MAIRYKTASGRPIRVETVLAVAGFVLSLIAYTAGALDSPLLDASLKARTTQLMRHTAIEKRDEQAEKAAAESYWIRYPDVARDSYYGRNGKLGLWGAREHFRQHGGREGRLWPSPR
jgi:hypothetical protein